MGTGCCRWGSEISNDLDDAAHSAVERGTIASFKIPRHVVALKDYPMTSSGTIQKLKLRELSIEELGLGFTRP